jgi:hypothetical protein
MTADAEFESKRDLLRKAFAGEADAGFPHLSRIPATNVVQFIDYFQSLNAACREDLLDDTSMLAAFLVVGGDGKPRPAAIERMRAVLGAPGSLNGGWRYTDIRFLKTVPRIAEFGGMDQWLRMYSGLALQPRVDFLPDPAAFVPAKAPLLRKLVKAALMRHGYETTSFGGGMRCLSPEGVLVDCALGSGMGQLRWLVATGATEATHGLVELACFSYEGLWGLRSDWDYLTEENAERCVEALPVLIEEAIRLRD